MKMIFRPFQVHCLLSIFCSTFCQSNRNFSSAVNNDNKERSRKLTIDLQSECEDCITEKVSAVVPHSAIVI